MSGDIHKRAFWLRSGSFELATHAHLPTTGPGSTAVLLCGTVGFEAIHSYRCMVRLGDALAAAGAATFRFDFAATGNSSGSARDRDLVSAWQKNIVDQVRNLREQWGFSHVTLVGFRLGAALVASVIDDLDIDGVAFWEPVTRGKAFVREIRAVAQFAEDPTAGNSGRIESGGFDFTASTVSDIGRLSLTIDPLPADVPILLISRAKNPRLHADAFDGRNPFEELRSKEYDRMICEPHYTKLPTESIACLERWHRSVAAKRRAAAEPADFQNTAEVAATDTGGVITESFLRTPDTGLFALVTRPADYEPGRSPTLILPNAGSVCSIGPNRVYVQVARALAASGMAIVRFDLRNLGDSTSGDVPAANDPYPESASADLGEMLEHCRSMLGSTAFVLAGLCSGSHTAYHYALANQDADVREILLINPLTYYYTPGMSLDNPLQHRTVRNAKSYVQSARRPENWHRLLTGRINYRRLAGFALRVTLRFFMNGIRKVAALWTRHPLSPMDEDLAGLQRRGLRISYVFSDTDPGYWIARVDSPNTFRKMVSSGESEVIFIKDADHTMSRAHNRTDLIAALRRHFSGDSAH